MWLLLVSCNIYLRTCDSWEIKLDCALPPESLLLHAFRYTFLVRRIIRCNGARGIVRGDAIRRDGRPMLQLLSGQFQGHMAPENISESFLGLEVVVPCSNSNGAQVVLVLYVPFCNQFTNKRRLFE